MELTGIKDRAVIVTGGGSGIGEAVSNEFGRSGARVAVTDVAGPEAARVAEGIRARGGRAEGWGLDVSKAEDVERVVTEVESRMGPVEILVNVAGIFKSTPVLELKEQDCDRLFSVNFRGVFLCSQAVARRMVPRRRGCIVTVASQSAKVVRAEQAAYGASKAAATYFAKSLGLELAHAGIRSNVVHPGVTDTPLSRRVWNSNPAVDAGDAARDAHIAGNPARFRVGIPLAKVARPEDLASVVLFLASDQAGHITMSEVIVDGGATLIA